jgi:hypothetical protein
VLRARAGVRQPEAGADLRVLGRQAYLNNEFALNVLCRQLASKAQSCGIQVSVGSRDSEILCQGTVILHTLSIEHY